jgi:2-polyprenyl-6-methoxyphenol hydroxylase-like FAD-dependent oxidoreductase
VSVVDAKVGYATRVYTDGAAELAGCPGVVVAATPETLTGGLALRAENDQWLVMGVGFGDRRPERDNDSFESFLAELGDPVLSDLVRRSTPAGDVHVHRQTASTRYWYEKVRPWPDGLIAVGDALCALDPVYGQGITVGAAQALVLRGAVCSGLGPRQSSSLQRKVASCVTTAWAIASSTDSSFPTAEAGQTRVEALMSVWTGALERLAVHGNERANDHMSRVYNLMASPVILLHPALLLAVARARLVGYGSPPARPKILEQLAGSRSST